MLKLLLVLLFGLACEAMGVVLISRGQKQMDGLTHVSVGEVLRLGKQAVTNGSFIGGVALEAAFFGCLLFLLSQADVSFIWPLSGLSFAFTTVSARFLLHETVVPLRWVGVGLIVLGAGVIAYTEKHKPSAASPSAAVPDGSRGSGPAHR
jgi:drug/metabolite transporter (DMT)-like permease